MQEAEKRKEAELQTATEKYNQRLEEASATLQDKSRKIGETSDDAEKQRLEAELQALKLKNEADQRAGQQAITDLQNKLTAEVEKARKELDRLTNEEQAHRFRGVVFDSIESFQLVVLTLFGGALGAAFSLMTRLGKMGVDPASGQAAHFAEVFFRITVGVLAASIIVIAMKANMVLGFASSATTGIQIWMLLILAIAAGASDWFQVSSGRWNRKSNLRRIRINLVKPRRSNCCRIAGRSSAHNRIVARGYLVRRMQFVASVESPAQKKPPVIHRRLSKGERV